MDDVLASCSCYLVRRLACVISHCRRGSHLSLSLSPLNALTRVLSFLGHLLICIILSLFFSVPRSHYATSSDGQTKTKSSSDVPSSPGLSKGVGFVRFDQRIEAERAIKHLHNTIPEGASEAITVKFANNPSNNAKALAPLAAYLSPQRRFPGPIHHPANRFRYIPLSPISRYEGQSASAAAAAAVLSNSRTPGYAAVPCPGPCLTLSCPHRYSPLTGTDLLTNPLLAGNPVNGAGWCLFVYNLAPDTEENLLWQLFGPFGAVQSVKVIRDLQTNKCKGFGFVTMTNYDEALVAIQSLNGYTLGNRVLQVSFKTNKCKS